MPAGILFSSSFIAEAALPLAELQGLYLQAHPGAVFVPAEFYLSPYFAGGENVRCAWNADGTLLAYAVFFAQNDTAWVELRCRPGIADAGALRAGLFSWLRERAVAGGQAKLAFQYLPVEEEGLDFARSIGARAAYSIFAMQRDLEQAIPDCPLPQGFALRHWRMETPAEQQAYVDARNECFPEAPLSLEEWQYFSTTPLWEQGTCVAGFAGDTLASGVTVFWEPQSQAASTEYIFTRAAYRGKGLARALLAEALRYLRAHGLRTAALEVRAENEHALGLYTNLGYTQVRESLVLVVDL